MLTLSEKVCILKTKNQSLQLLIAVVLLRFLGLWFSIGMWPEYIMVAFNV
jgi:hypothetical protein